MEQDIGELMRRRRAGLGLSLREVAERVGCAVSYLSQIENGHKTQPGEELLGRVEEALALPPGALVEVARWARMPEHVRAEMSKLDAMRREITRLGAKEQGLRRLMELVRQGGTGGLDQAYRSDELRRLVDELDPQGVNAAAHRAGEEPSATLEAARRAASDERGEADEPAERGEEAQRRESQDHGDQSEHGDQAAGQSQRGEQSQRQGPSQRGGAAPRGEQVQRGATRSPLSGATVARAASEPVPLALAVEIPLINRVAAGYPREFTDLGYPARIADEYVRVPSEWEGAGDADAFAARVVGDSMLPAYAAGDIVVFSPLKAVRSGMDCFVRLERDAETTFKRVYFETAASGEGLIRLQPLNSAYPPRILQREEVAGLYAAVSVIRPIGGA